MIILKSLLTEGSAPELTSGFMAMVQKWENSKDYVRGGWNSNLEKWYPHKSPEAGNPTIAYGHKLTNTDVSTGRFKNGITDAQAKALFVSDLEIARSKAIALVPKYASLPITTKQALVNACYRGELSNIKSPKTLELMRANKWSMVPAEYLDHAEYKSAGENVRGRMEWNAAQFKNTSNVVKSKSTTPAKKTTSTPPKTGLQGAFDYLKQMYAKNDAAIAAAAKSKTTPTTYHVVKSGDTLSAIAVKYKTTVPNIKKINNLKTDSIKPGQKLKVK
jgi:LysM repeat protein